MILNQYRNWDLDIQDGDFEFSIQRKIETLA